jgi:ATP-dependent RNA helicase DeaD
LREAIVSEDNEHFRVVVDALSDEFDLVEIAMGAVKLYHQATIGDSEDEEQDIPDANAKPGAERPRPGGAPAAGAPKRKREDGARPYGLGRNSGAEMTKLFITAGRQAGVRPQDLVGAIANEAGVPGSAIGAIEITDRFSLVEVPEEAANQVIKALRETKIRGKKVTVRRDGEK